MTARSPCPTSSGPTVEMQSNAEITRKRAMQASDDRQAKITLGPSNTAQIHPEGFVQQSETLELRVEVVCTELYLRFTLMKRACRGLSRMHADTSSIELSASPNLIINKPTHSSDNPRASTHMRCPMPKKKDPDSRAACRCMLF
eukprot:20508-Heterococcus_DN1.PRE.3